MEIDGVSIQVERKPIKNMHLAVYPPDARVHLSLPDYLTDDDAYSYVVSKWEWVLKQRKAILEQPRQSEREYVSGENHYSLGVRYLLRVEYTTHGPNEILTKGNLMIMRVRKETTTERREALLSEWNRDNLKKCLTSLMEKWTESLNEPDVKWRIKQMKTQWGSCGIKTRSIIFNLELARVPIECIEYVVVHELTHLKSKHHDKVFEVLMNKRLPRWRSLREQLNNFIALPM